MDNNKKKNGVIVGLLLGIVIMLVVFVALFATNTISFTSKTNTNESGTTNTEENNTLSNDEAISIGKELYAKAIEMQHVYGLIPYCGYSMDEVLNKKKTNFGIENHGIEYYETDYNSLESLKESLAKYFSSSIIDKLVKDETTNNEVITDIAKIKENELANYVIYDNKLYCRGHARKGNVNFYLNEYDITIDSIEQNKIIYNVKSAYVKDGPNNTRCIEASYNNCKEEDKEYKNTKFVIEQINDNWIISEYTMFGYDANDNNVTTLK